MRKTGKTRKTLTPLTKLTAVWMKINIAVNRFELAIRDTSIKLVVITKHLMPVSLNV